jgi:4-nitrophenyl phosphatase
MDMDGVLYRGDTALPGAKEFLSFLDVRGIRYLMLTNNSVRTPEGWSEKMAALGMPVSAGRVMTAAQATAAYLHKSAPQGGKVYIIGGRGLTEAVLEAHPGLFTLDVRRPDFVLVGLDPQLTYEKLKCACLAIRAGAHFIASNPDLTFPTEEGIVPGAGSIVAALEACSDVKALVIGKPEPYAFELALEQLGAQRETTAMLGDRLDTDILGGLRAGLTTVMVLTGISSQADLEASPYQPDYVYADLPELMKAWGALPAVGRHTR